MPATRFSFDLIAVGELLVDLIATTKTPDLEPATSFEWRPGGSPANLVRTLALAGRRTALMAHVGDEGLGRFLVTELDHTELDHVGVETGFIRRSLTAPTTAVLLSRSAGTADFVAYRHADALLQPEDIPVETLKRARFVHTTAFALSREPARTTICDALSRAAAAGATLTLDINYAPSIWPDRAEAQSVLQSLIGRGAYVKASDDDIERLYGASLSVRDGAARLHEEGAELVCLTLGSDGVRVSWEGGAEHAEVPAAPVDRVADATGAGDAFWGGFLAAMLRGDAPPACARIGSQVAARKLRITGPLTSLEGLFDASTFPDDRSSKPSQGAS